MRVRRTLSKHASTLLFCIVKVGDCVFMNILFFIISILFSNPFFLFVGDVGVPRDEARSKEYRVMAGEIAKSLGVSLKTVAPKK